MSRACAHAYNTFGSKSTGYAISCLRITDFCRCALTQHACMLQGNGSSYIAHNESKERNGALVEAKADK